MIGDVFFEDEESTKSAIISNCGKYRYLLERSWGFGSTCLFVMLNPSTADALKDDPTIRRCMAFTKLWGYGALSVVNLYAFRSTNPEALFALKYHDAVGEGNDHHIVAQATKASMVIAAWGTLGRRKNRDFKVMNLLTKRAKVQVHCLGVTSDNSPKHPLYLKHDTQPIIYKGRQ